MLLGAGLVTVLIAHGATVSETIAIWNNSQSYKIAWAVVPTLAYLLWRERGRFSTLTPSASVLGVVMAIASAALWIAADLMNISEGRQFAVVAAIIAIALGALGWSVFKALLPYLAMLAFLVPTGRFLLVPLKYIAVGFVDGYAAVVGLPFRTDGFAMFVDGQRYLVINYCAGLPYVLTYLFIGLTMGLLIYRTVWRIAAVALLGGGLAIVANGVRISGIVTYDFMTGSELTLAQHRYFELPVLAVSLAVLFTIFSRLAPEPAPETGPRSPVEAPGTILKSAGTVLIAAILFSSVPFVSQDSARNTSETVARQVLPETLSGWTLEKDDPAWQPRTRIETVATALAVYARDTHRIAVFVAHATSHRDKVSGGAIDLVADESWMPSIERHFSACDGPVCHDIRYDRMVLRDSDRVRHVYSVHTIDGATTASTFAFRLRRALSTLKGGSASAAFIAIASEDAHGLEPAEIARLINALSML